MKPQAMARDFTRPTLKLTQMLRTDALDPDMVRMEIPTAMMPETARIIQVPVLD